MVHRKHSPAPSLGSPEAGPSVRSTNRDVELRQHQTVTHVDLGNHGRKAEGHYTRGLTHGGQSKKDPILTVLDPSDRFTLWGFGAGQRQLSSTSRWRATNVQYIMFAEKGIKVPIVFSRKPALAQPLSVVVQEEVCVPDLEPRFQSAWVSRPCPVDRVGNQSQEIRLTEIIVHTKRGAKDTATFVPPDPCHRLRTPPDAGDQHRGGVGR
jgi:hypothetical protein